MGQWKLLERQALILLRAVIGRWQTLQLVGLKGPLSPALYVGIICSSHEGNTLITFKVKTWLHIKIILSATANQLLKLGV